MGKVVLDSNIIIYLSKGIIDVDGLSIDEEDELYVSLITYMEVLSFNFGSLSEEKFIRKLLNEFGVIEISKEIAEKAITLRKKYRLKLPNAIICASAAVCNAILVTADVELKKVEEVDIRIISLFA